jgi:hypothetical protein
MLYGKQPTQSIRSFPGGAFRTAVADYPGQASVELAAIVANRSAQIPWRVSMTLGRTAFSVAAVMLLGIATPASTQQSEPGAGGELYEKVQSEFAEAYNRKDIPRWRHASARTECVSHPLAFSVAGRRSVANCKESWLIWGFTIIA